MKFAPINFQIRGSSQNKLTPEDIVKRGCYSQHFIITLGFLLEMLNYQGFDSMIRKVDANEMDYHFSNIGEMIKEFASESIEVIVLLDDARKAEAKLKEKYLTELNKLKKQ